MTDELLATWLDTGAALLAIPVDPSWRTSILGHLAVTLRHGEAVLALALPDEAEPAPVFHP